MDGKDFGRLIARNCALPRNRIKRHARSVIGLTRGEFQDSGDVRRFKQRIVRENLAMRPPPTGRARP
jgi:hypothetical protein